MKVTVTHEEYFQLFSAMLWIKYHADQLTTAQLSHLAESNQHHHDVKKAVLEELEKRKAKLIQIIANVTNDIPA